MTSKQTQPVHQNYGSMHQASENDSRLETASSQEAVAHLHHNNKDGIVEVTEPPAPKLQPKLDLGEPIVQESVKRLFKHLKTLMASLAAALGSVALGTIIGYTSPAIPDLNSGRSPFHLNEMEISVVASIISLGGLLGAQVGGFLLDRFGRKTTVIATTVPFAAGWAIIAASPNVYCMCVGRFLTGLCAGVMDVGVPVYISEIAAPSVRGFMGSCYELGTNFGLLFVFVSGCFLRWNYLAIACLCIPVLQIFCLLPMPESPRWLLVKGRRLEGMVMMRWLRGDGVDISEELAEMEEHLKQSSSRVECNEFRQPTFYKPLGIIIGLLFFQQAAGYGAIPEYLVSIFASAGSTLDPYVQTAVFGAVGFASNLASAFLVDRAGRRIMLFASAAIMALSLAGLASFFTVKSALSNDDLGNLVWLPTVALNAYNFGVALGYGPIPFYLASEIFSLRFRGVGGGVGISSVWLFAFATALAFPHLLSAMTDQGVYWMLACFSVLGVVFAFFFVPETKGKSLEEIEEIFKN